MTAQEKAQSLFDKMWNIIAPLPDVARDCALVVCEEFIKYHERQLHNSAILHHATERSYWHQVRVKIEVLEKPST